MKEVDIITKKKNVLLAVVASLLTVVAIISAILLIGRKPKSTSLQETETAIADSNKEQKSNVFVVSGEKSKNGKRLKVTVSLEGNVSICNFKLGIRFDSTRLKLIDYDNELSVYSPTVNPDKKGSKIQWNRGVSDIIELTWASADNCTSNADIIELEFEVLDSVDEADWILLSVEDIGELNDSFVVEQPIYEIEYRKFTSG